MFSVKPGSRNEKQVDTHTSNADTQRTSAKFEKYVTITDHSTLSSYSLFLFIRFGKKKTHVGSLTDHRRAHFGVLSWFIYTCFRGLYCRLRLHTAHDVLSKDRPFGKRSWNEGSHFKFFSMAQTHTASGTVDKFFSSSLIRFHRSRRSLDADGNRFPTSMNARWRL